MSGTREDRVLHIAIGLISDGEGRVLLVRKTGSAVFMQPGGKIEPGERPVEALVREIEEELGLTVPIESAVPLGAFTAAAANEPGYRVEAMLFGLPSSRDVTPAAEIAEIRWVDPMAIDGLPLAELTREHILPLCRPSGGLLGR